MENNGEAVYKKILIPVSRTTNMKYIMEFVNHFLHEGGKITFLHVTVSNTIPISPGEWRRALNAISTTHMLKGEGSMQVYYAVKNSSSIVTGILDEAWSEGYDLILFANSTYRRHLNHLFGNKIDEVICNSPIETAVISYRDDMPLKYGRILIPISGYKHALRAIKMAELLAKKYGSEITVMYVGTEKDDPRQVITPVTSDLKGNGLKHRAIFRTGPVVETILAEAEKNYDLIAIGATERQQPYNFVTGSTADRLIKKSSCPVLMIKTTSSAQ
ncbi:predicted universal stress protein A [Methanocella arvoryzae MRE50]|uniref:Predicted universal stress protein A n=2 Tax=Methanocella TaxID=570266 RepID=Q0W0J6_METAR|nr:predicted universal stress protein A [Methanocella arvoryzae MRE50]